MSHLNKVGPLFHPAQLLALQMINITFLTSTLNKCTMSTFKKSHWRKMNLIQCELTQWHFVFIFKVKYVLLLWSTFIR